MPRLIPNSMPAERIGARCSFAETMESAAKVIANGGELFGTPTIDFGAILNGTTDYIKYNLQGHELSSVEISIVYEFWPGFEAGDGLNHYLYASTSDNYTILKRSTNVLLIVLGGTAITSIALSTYEPYWNTDERNVLVLSSTTGNTNVWLNGAQILTGSATAWTPVVTTELFIGIDSALTAGRYYKGKVGQAKIFNSLLTAQDAQNFYDNSTYNYPNDALIHLPMRACDHDPTNTRTLDVSGNGNHATFGDGVTPTTYPTKLQKRGYSFDGGDYMISAPVDVPTTSQNTFACVISNPALNVTDYILSVASPGNVDIFGWIIIASGQLRYYSGGGAASNYASYDISDLGNHTVIGVHDGVNTKIYVDGHPGTDAATPLSPDLSGTQSLTVGSAITAGAKYTGNIHQAIILPIGLTPLQVADLHIRMLKQVNHV